MRIISGRARGRRLTPLQGTHTRPTSDRVRESLFSILGDVRDCAVLDGFAGTGALGLEAWSRGATRCVLVDQNRRAASTIRDNIKLLRAPDDEVTLIQLPLARAIERLREPFDLIFLDPPYHTTLLQESLTLLAERLDLCPPDTLIVAEQEHDEASLNPPRFTIEDVRVYGRTRLTLLRRVEDEPREGGEEVT